MEEERMIDGQTEVQPLPDMDPELSAPLVASDLGTKGTNPPVSSSLSDGRNVPRLAEESSAALLGVSTGKQRRDIAAQSSNSASIESSLADTCQVPDNIANCTHEVAEQRHPGGTPMDIDGAVLSPQRSARRRGHAHREVKTAAICLVQTARPRGAPHNLSRRKPRVQRQQLMTYKELGRMVTKVPLAEDPRIQIACPLPWVTMKLK